ncbi:hypothetical protein ACNAW0_25690 [Micromonospora sp. SL1-18]|uniref:hypothetical protein n=1 Tax=Micromonospora sp. SL1-18 TaxID=3399128 RepID=UPI003A4E14F9
MAERSTARPADGAAQDDDPNEIDSWIAHLSRPATSDSDTYDEWPEAAPLQWRADVPDPDEESCQPEDTNQEHEARHTRHRADQQYEEYEQHDGAYGQHEYAYRGSDPVTDPAPAGYEPDQTYRGDEHGQSPWEERRAQATYGPIDAGPVREAAHSGLQETYGVPEVGYAHEEHYPHDDDAGLNEHRYGGSAPQYPEAIEDVPTQMLHNLALDARPRPAGRRRWLIAVGGLAVGALLCAMAFTWGSDRPPEGALPLVTATIPPDASEEPIAVPEMPTATPSSATPRSSSATPRTTPKVTRSPSPPPSVTHPAAPPPTRAVATPTQTRSASPLLLGPSSNDGVANMVQGYCDRHAAGSSAAPRNDGSWQCTRLLSASTVDMNVACRDTYGSDAYARPSNTGDPYAWRCYR